MLNEIMKKKKKNRNATTWKTTNVDYTFPTVILLDEQICHCVNIFSPSFYKSLQKTMLWKKILKIGIRF